MTDIDESVLLGEPAEHHDEPIDENALLDEKEIKEEVDDLYDEAIAPTTNSEASENKSESAAETTAAQASAIAARPAPSSEGRKYCCYVGNLLWYTTDSDLFKAIASTGLSYSQFADMKFFENRTNGQSKGYALLVLNSDAAVRQLMEQLPTKPIHGHSPTVLSYNKTNQAKLEEAMAKNQTRPDVKKKTYTIEEGGCLNMGTIRIGTAGAQTGRVGTTTTGRPNPPPLMMQPMTRPASLMSQPNPQQAPSNQMRLTIGGQPVTMMNRAPIGAPQQGLMGSAPLGGLQQTIQQPQMLMGGQQMRPMMQSTMGMQPMMGMNLGAPPPMNNQFQNRPPQLGGLGVQPLMQMNTAMRPPANGMQPVHVNPQMFPGMQQPPLSDAEFEDVMNRNRTVSSSAISRAITDAAVGDIKGATETLLTAIALIKQSRIGHDERCRQLVYSLEDTLKGLEHKGYSSRSSKSHRDRSRSRERDRKRRRRSRSRSRSYSRSPSPRRRRY
uniref:RRM domain-containing protein n=1 Tax=Caenorhabditis japonica TaxID=281687 RepID=A0A8R1HIG9_CAEJA